MPDTSSSRLPSSFGWLNATQFFGALNDNMFKLFVVFFAIHVEGNAAASRVMAIGGALFVLPFLLFSAWSGTLADRLSKKRILVATKVMEVAIMLLGFGAFYFKSELGLYGVLFLMSVQSAIFSPSKYGIVPELVGKDLLSKANSQLVLYTYLAIILGTACAPLLTELVHSSYGKAQLGCLAIAMAGLLASLFIPYTVPAGSTKKASPMFVRDIWRNLWSIRKDRYLLQAVIAAAYFMLLGAFLQLNMIPYGIQYLGLTQEKSAYLFFAAAIGIAVGAVCAGKLSGRNIEFGIVPLGALVLTGSTVMLNFVPASLSAVYPMVFLAGLGAGLFIVPLDAFIQFRAPRQQLGEILAASGFLGWVGVLLASGLVFLLGALKITAAKGFVVMGLLTLALTIVTFKVLPDFLLRFVLVVITRLAYRIRVIGSENIPVEGPALLVCNHVSYLDALLLEATQQRRIRFLMARNMYESMRFLKPFLKLGGVIPIAMDDSPKKLVESLHAARAAMDEGYIVCIFAEGALTRTGMLHEFRRGFEKIVKNSDYPIIPAYLGGAWGSIYSYYHGQLVKRWPTLLRYPVTVLFGAPLPAKSTAAEVRTAVMGLACDYFNDRKPRRHSLREHFVRSARRNWGQPAIADTTGKKMTYGQTLVGALLLKDLLTAEEVGPRHVGLLLPPSVGGVLTNLAVSLLGKIPVNLNFTASESAMASAVRQCDIRTIVTSRAFLEKMPQIKLSVPAVYLEDLFPRIDRRQKIRAYLKGRFAPRRWLAASHGFNPDDVATVIFSSGSTGEPKGVMLSHHNILSNIESLRMVFRSSPNDNVCAALPFFHSLGFTGTLWFPLLGGFSATYHPNPLDGAKIAEIVRTYRSTLLFATPTFLTIYLRKAAKEDFASLKFVVCGAEKMKPRLVEAFEEKFGVHPLEGYGATELAPVATLSLPHVESGGVFQAGWKEGSVGLPLPGVALKVVDPDTGAMRPAGEAGLLMIRGPNVMLGYLNRPDLTEAAIKDGWYCTGDIARIDSDGFVVITDRLSRFSKIGGEMVPHLAIEEELLKRLGKAEQVLAVAAVPDEKRGERLVVLFTKDAGDAATLARWMEESALPNLWKPAADSYYPIDSIPLLGSGKLDLGALKNKARELAGAEKT